MLKKKVQKLVTKSNFKLTGRNFKVYNQYICYLLPLYTSTETILSSVNALQGTLDQTETFTSDEIIGWEDLMIKLITTVIFL